MKERLKELIRYHRIKQFFERYERVLMPAVLVLGFVVDFLTFKSLPLQTAFALLAFYLLLVGVFISYLHFYDQHKTVQTQRFFKYVRLSSPFIIQYAFGALLSASLIFYWFSGAISVSWPFLGLLVILMASNELFRRVYLKPAVQISVYFFLTFSILSLVLPFFFQSIDPKWFILAGVIALIFILIFIATLSRFIKSIKRVRVPLVISVLLIFSCFNALYFFKLIPPIPLSLTDAGVYHLVSRSGSGYTLVTEEKTFLMQFLPRETIHLQANDRAFVFTSIFAPSNLNIPIFHIWEYYDTISKVWIQKDRLSYTVSGGRDGGYRGYSLKTRLQAGKWRVTVQTSRRQTLGRVYFIVEIVDQLPTLVEIRK